MNEFEIFLKEMEVADAFCESKIANAYLEACTTFTESEASDRLKDAKANVANAQAGLIENLDHIIDSVITAIENFFQMLREKLQELTYRMGDAVASIPKLSPRYKALRHECEAAYASYLKNLEKVLSGDLKASDLAKDAYLTTAEEPKLREDCMSRVQKAVKKAVSMKSSTVYMLSDDMFYRLEDMAVQFQRKLRVKTGSMNKKANRADRRVIRYASMQAASVCRAITREMLKAA